MERKAFPRCSSLCLPKKHGQLCAVWSWVRPHVADGTCMVEKNSYLQAGCKPSGSADFLMLNILLKAQRMGKANWRASSLFIPCSSVPAAWCGADWSQQNVALQIFLLYKIREFFFALQENLCFFWVPLPINWCAYVWFALTAFRFENIIIFTLVIWLSVGASKCNPLLSEKYYKVI